MKRILLGPVLFVALGAALGYGIDRVGTRVAPVYPAESERFERLFARADEIEVLAVGNSHCLAIDFVGLGMPRSGYHVWHPGQDLFEVESQMAALLPRLPAVDTVIFCVSFASFHRDNAAATIADRTGVRRKFYAMPPAYGPIAGDWENWLKGRFASLSREDHGRSVLTGLTLDWSHPDRPEPVIPNLDATGLIDLRRKETEQDFDALRLTAADITVPRHYNLQLDMQANNAALPDAAVAAFERTLDMFAARGIRVICITAPVFEEYARKYDRDTVRFMRASMARLATERGLEYHDFSDDRQFSGVAGLFANPDHLNALGSRRFSEHRLKPLLEGEP